MAKPKAKVKKELTMAVRGVQNQKRQACRVAEQARKAEALAAAAELEKHRSISSFSMPRPAPKRPQSWTLICLGRARQTPSVLPR
jgi:hypothetical protein